MREKERYGVWEEEFGEGGRGRVRGGVTVRHLSQVPGLHMLLYYGVGRGAVVVVEGRLDEGRSLFEGVGGESSGCKGYLMLLSFVVLCKDGGMVRC